MGPVGAVWRDDGTIVFGGSDGIYRVRADGGMPERVVAVDGQDRVFVSDFLPDGDTVIAAERLTSNSWDTGDIVAYSLATGARKLLIAGGTDARYVPTGHLVYASGDTLFGIAFDAQKLEVSGGAIPLVEGVQRANTYTGAANFGIARDGTLAYLEDTTASTNTLVWVDRNGKEEPIDIPPRFYIYAQLSPDGTRIALDSRDEDSDIWVFDLERKTLQRLTFGADTDRVPVWSPDGRRIAFSSATADGDNVYWQAADGSGTAELLVRGTASQPRFATAFTPTGEGLLLAESANDISYVQTGDPDSIELLISTPAAEYNATVSPDGRWLAYQSDESGRDEVYVRPFPDVDTGRWQVSTTGGTRPRWSSDGSELFFLRFDDGGLTEIVTVAVDTASVDTFRQGIPEALFRGPYAVLNSMRGVYDVTADSQRFLLIKSSAGNDELPQRRVVIVQNWTEELKRLLPVD